MMEKKYYLILDQGTTSCRSILFDKNFKQVEKASILLTQSFPNKGWVEHDPIEIWNSQKSTMQQVLIKANVKIDEIIAIGISNQRETIIAFDKTTAIPAYNAIVWQDSRTSETCKQLENYKNMIKEKTGLVLNPYFSASKMQWILENVKKARDLMNQNNLLFGTIDTWLLYKMTKKSVFATDFTNASRTMLFNINSLKWDQELLDLFQIKKECLATPYPSNHLFGYLDNSIIDPLSKGQTPICGIAGDQQASLFGQQCFSLADTKATFGTGCFIIMNTNNIKIDSKNQLLTTLACCLENSPVQYALEGSVFNAGTVIEWLSNDLKVLYNPQEATWYSELALTHQQEDLYFVPAFTGLGAPYWDVNARGLIIGIDRSTKREHIIKAAIDGVVYQLKDVIDSMLSENENLNLTHLKIDGGLSQSFYLDQFLADILQVSVRRSQTIESSALGICYLCALALNLITQNSLLKQPSESYCPSIPLEQAKKLHLKWQKAVQKALNWKS